MAHKPRSSADEGNIPKMPVKNWVMAIIHDKGERRPRDALSIMNEVFIFMKELLPSIESEFGFRSCGYGPYSEKVAGSINQLLSSNILGMEENESLFLGRYRYLLTENGAEETDRVVLGLPKALREDMEFMRITTTHMGLTGMLQYIQSIYPEYIYLHDRGEKIV